MTGISKNGDQMVISLGAGGQKVRDFIGDLKTGAEGGIRTPTVLLPPAPQAGASASSATSAEGLIEIFQPDPLVRLLKSSRSERFVPVLRT
jgi:hypothetical protein